MTTATKKKRVVKPLVTPTQQLCDLVSQDSDSRYCVPTNVKALKDYSLKITFSRNTRDGNWWEAKLYKNGKQIIIVENVGNGGANLYYATKNSTCFGQDLKDFLEASANAYEDNEYIADERAISFLDIIGNL